MPTLAYVVTGPDVEVVDTSTNTIIGNIIAGALPSAIAITPNGRFGFVTNSASNDVTVIDTCNNAQISYIRVGEFPTAVAITPNGRFAYVANSDSDTVSVINIITLTVEATIPVGHFPEGVAISLNGNFAYVTNAMSDTVSVIDISTNTVTDTIPVGSFPIGIAVSSTNFIYVCNQGSNSISVIDFFTNKVVDTIPVDGIPSNLAIRPDGKYIYVAIGNLDVVDVVFTGNNRLVNTVEVGHIPLGIAITPDGNFVYVTNLVSGTVSVIDTISNTVVDEISGFEGPKNVTIANIPPCPSPSDSICIETTRIFDSCMFEEQQEKTFELPNSIEDWVVHCEVIETTSKILDITKVNEQLNTVNVKLQIKVALGFIRECSNNPVFEKVVYFDKTVTLTSPEGAAISCDINNATCECIKTSDISCNHNISCTVKVMASVKSKKLVQIQVPFLGNCESEQCCPCEGIPVAPGKSLTLPSEPSQVSKIKFAAKTNPGMTSRFVTLFNVIPLNFITVTYELKQFEINLPHGPYPIENISLRNLGESTIYVYKLTTE